MTRFLGHLRSNVVAYLALFVALGGTSYAAFSMPAGSVGNRALKNHSITPVKLDRSQIAGYVRDWAHDRPAGRSWPRGRALTWCDGMTSRVPHSRRPRQLEPADPSAHALR